MRIDWILNQEGKACLNLRPIVPLGDEVVPSGDVVAVAHLVEEATLVAEAEEIPSRQRTSSHCVNFVAEPTIRYSSAISTLIRIT
jgi:hypothetical protein